MTENSESKSKTPTSDLPRPIDVYWRQAAEGRFILPCCNDCNHHFLPPRMYCPACGSKSLGWHQSAGIGEIYSFSVIEKTPDKRFAEATPYVIALATLEDLSPGSRFYARIVDVEPDQVYVGQRVAVAIREVGGAGLRPVLIAMEDL